MHSTRIVAYGFGGGYEPGMGSDSSLEVESFLRETFTSGKPPSINSVRLKTIGKYDVLKGLCDVAFSGG